MTGDKFDMTEESLLSFEYTGFSLSRYKYGDVMIDQHHYLRKLEGIPLDASMKCFQSMRMKLAWLANLKPGCLFEIAQLAQLTEEMFREQPEVYIKRLNNGINFAMDNLTALKVSKLEAKSLKIFGFSDASFANNHDQSSQLGYIIFLGDRSGAVVPLLFRSYNARRITRSAMSGEIIAFSNMFDFAIAIIQDLAKMIGRNFPVQL